MVSFPVALRKNFQSPPAARSAASPYPAERCGGSAQHIYPLLPIEPLCHLWKKVVFEQGVEGGFASLHFLQSSFASWGNKAELGPLHPPPRSTCVPQISSPNAGSGASPWGWLPALWLHCASGELHSLVQEVLALTSGRWKVHTPPALFLST